jgi:hypothetical protein
MEDTNFRFPADASFEEFTMTTAFQGNDKMDTLCFPIRGVFSGVENLHYFSIFIPSD